MSENQIEKDLRVMKRGTELAKRIGEIIAEDARFARATTLTGASQALLASLILATVARMKGETLTVGDETYDAEEIDYASKYVMTHAIFEHAGVQR
jgi:hypothetical protein